MFKDLLFINDALKIVFNMDTSKPHNFSGTEEHPNINNKDYEKFNNYLLTAGSFDLKILIGGLNLLAYGHLEDKKNIIDFIKKNSKKIISSIDNIVPNLNDTYDNYSKQYYENLINKDFSYNLLEDIDVPHKLELSQKHYYGLQYLLRFWVQNCYLDFEEWYLKSSRIDLKIYVANLILNPYYSSFSYNRILIGSKINWLKAYYILTQYNISKFISYGDGSINEIINSSLNDKEKLDILVFYLFKNYNRFDGNFKNKEQLSLDLNLFQKINWQSLLTVDYLKNINLWLDKYHILNEIIKLIENKSVKIPLYDYILDKIELYLEKDLPTGHEILLSNVYGQIIFDYGESKISATEDKYNKIKSLLLKPYSYHRNTKQWDLNICKLIFYTIALYIANETNAEKCKNLIDTFINVKNGLPHYLDDDINSFINQLEQQLPNQ